MQREHNGAISAGMAGYQAYQAWSAIQQLATFRVEVQRGIARGDRFAQVGANVQPRTIARSGNLRIDTDGSGPDHGNETKYQPNGRILMLPSRQAC